MDNDNFYDKGNQNGGQPYQNMGGQYQPQQTYQQPYNQYQQPGYMSGIEMEEPVSFGDWMVTILLTYIPCVNLILMFIWAFGSSTKKSKSNFAKARLVWMLIGTILGAIVSFIYIGAIMALLDKGGYF